MWVLQVTIMMDDDADDPVIQELDVYLSKQLAQHLYLLQVSLKN